MSKRRQAHWDNYPTDQDGDQYKQRQRRGPPPPALRLLREPPTQITHYNSMPPQRTSHKHKRFILGIPLRPNPTDSTAIEVNCHRSINHRRLNNLELHKQHDEPRMRSLIDYAIAGIRHRGGIAVNWDDSRLGIWLNCQGEVVSRDPYFNNYHNALAFVFFVQEVDDLWAGPLHPYHNQSEWVNIGDALYEMSGHEVFTKILKSIQQRHGPSLVSSTTAHNATRASSAFTPRITTWSAASSSRDPQHDI